MLTKNSHIYKNDGFHTSEHLEMSRNDFVPDKIPYKQ